MLKSVNRLAVSFFFFTFGAVFNFLYTRMGKPVSPLAWRRRQIAAAIAAEAATVAPAQSKSGKSKSGKSSTPQKSE